MSVAEHKSFSCGLIEKACVLGTKKIIATILTMTKLVKVAMGKT